MPRALLVGLALLALTSFSVSVYLEFHELDYLQSHPIMVNLISGVVGFSSGFLTLSIVINWLIERKWIIDRLVRLDDAAAKIDEFIAVVGGSTWDDSSPERQAAMRESFYSDVTDALATFGIDQDPIIAQFVRGFEANFTGKGYDVTRTFPGALQHGATVVHWYNGPAALVRVVTMHPRVRRYRRITKKFVKAREAKLIGAKITQVQGDKIARIDDEYGILEKY